MRNDEPGALRRNAPGYSRDLNLINLIRPLYGLSSSSGYAEVVLDSFDLGIGFADSAVIVGR